ncbi:ribonuclease [Rhizobiaceae bacterium]|nr:ribonuclease [Rhizobiaceae bacterium]
MTMKLGCSLSGVEIRDDMTACQRLAALAVAGLVMLTGCTEAEAPDGPAFDGPMVLALTWQPAFCEGRSKVRECRSQRAGRFDAQNLSLHGLWPGPRGVEYCGVDRETRRLSWSRLPGLRLDKPMQQRLLEVMPGTQSFLHRHEWTKHGTCYGTNEQRYFTDALSLLDEVNGSSLRTLLARSVGREVSTRALRDAVSRDYGRGAGERLSVTCKRDGRRNLMLELRFNLAGGIEDGLAGALSRGRRVGEGCRSGIVDPVGLQ